MRVREGFGLKFFYSAALGSALSAVLGVLSPTVLTRSSALQSTAPPQPESLQAIIDRECGKGVFIVRLDESFADCTRCRRDKVQTINLSHPNWIRNAQAHANTHPNISGMRALES